MNMKTFIILRELIKKPWREISLGNDFFIYSDGENIITKSDGILCADISLNRFIFLCEDVPDAVIFKIVNEHGLLQ